VALFLAGLPEQALPHLTRGRDAALGDEDRAALDDCIDAAERQCAAPSRSDR
jgi:hypothetical protein